MALTTENSSSGDSLLPSRVRVIWAEPQNRAVSLNFFFTASKSSVKGRAGSRYTVIPALFPFMTTGFCMKEASFLL